MLTNCCRLLSFSLLAGIAAAQCQFTTLSSQSAGASCNFYSTGCCAVPSGPAQLSAALDATNCTLDFGVFAIEGCCGVTVPLRVLAIGFAPAATPVPQFGQACTLWLAPAIVLDFTTPSITVPIPPTLPPLTFYAQGAAVVVDAFTPQNSAVTLTAAAAITLQ